MCGLPYTCIEMFSCLPRLRPHRLALLGFSPRRGGAVPAFDPSMDSGGGGVALCDLETGKSRSAGRVPPSLPFRVLRAQSRCLVTWSLQGPLEPVFFLFCS